MVGQMLEMVETLAVLGLMNGRRCFVGMRRQCQKRSARGGGIWDFHISSEWSRGRKRRINGC